MGLWIQIYLIFMDVYNIFNSMEFLCLSLQLRIL